LIKKIITYLIVFLYITICNAQNPNYFVIGEKELANSDLYTLLYHDKTDVLFVGTNNGLFAYQQNKFIKIQRAKGQVGTSVFRLSQDKQGNIYCCNLNGQIFKVKGQTLELFFELEKKHVNSFFDFLIANDDNIIVKGNILLCVDANGEVIKKWFENDGGNVYNFQKLFSNGEVIITYATLNKKAVYVYDHNKFFLDDSYKMLKDEADEGLDIYTSFFAFNGVLFSYNKNESFNTEVEEYKSIVNMDWSQFMFQLNSDEILFLSRTNGGQIVGFNDNKTLIVKQHLFDDDFLSCATLNKSGTLFLGSFGEGIKVIPDKEILSTESEELFLSITTSPKNDVYISTRSGKVFNSQQKVPLLINKKNLDYIFFTKQKYKDFNLIFENNFLKRVGAIKDVIEVNDSLHIVVSSNGMDVISNVSNPDLNELYFNYKLDGHLWRLTSKSARYASVGYDKVTNMIYYATNFGTFKRHWTKKESDEILYFDESILSNDILTFDDKLILATQNDGILIYKNSKLINILNIKDGLLSNTVKKIGVKNDWLIILTGKGLQLYNFKTNKFDGIGIEEGVIDNDKITDFALSDDKIWLLEKHKYYSLDIDVVKSKNTMGRLYIDSILVNSTLINNEIEHFFNYDQNRLEFYFDYRDLETKKETKIQYTLDGFYSKWKSLSSEENSIEFQSLPVGQYVFKIKANYRSQNTNVFEYPFEIKPPFWQRLWFYILLIVVTVLIVVLLARYRLLQTKKKNKIILEREVMSKDLAQTKLKAIRSQMNPHFIFNALNSIQNLVLQQDVDKSYDYIVLFSELVRSSLTYSETEFILLSKEIEFLKVYLELEKLRYGEELNYNIEYNGSDDVKIPSLVVQPFIENALLHGLSHKKGVKNISINFTIGEQLICTIIDNGIGRAKAEIIKNRQNKQHASFSTKAIKQRMKILSNQYKMEASFKYEDVLIDGIVCGTRVEIIMPFQYF